ncbi:MAG: hypothetical protein E7615_00850 [Ruminococcaceae bacterium]|nr:hypothetical protein [Oscillospiraceae bacterium]
MDWKSVGKSILFPNIVIMIILVPVSLVLLIGSMVLIGTKSVIAIISYVLSSYTLMVWCLKTPMLIDYFKRFKEENDFVKKWRTDHRLRVNVSLYGSLTWNAFYGCFQLWLGFYYKTFWFCSLGAYYICLALMRFLLVRHTRRYVPGERMREELKKYRACGWVFLLMNLALALIIFFMLYWDRTFKHHIITAIAMAAYTFSAFAVAIVNLIKYRKYKSPIYSASKIISLAVACVSMLTLTSTLLTTFGEGTMDAFSQKIMLASVGGTVSVAVIVMAVYMIVTGAKKLKSINCPKGVNHG